MSTKDDKPAGSGLISLILGIVVIGVVFICWRFGVDVRKVKPEVVLAGWSVVSGGAMALWGLGRWRKYEVWVGQPTITAWAGIFAVTFTIWAIIADK
jgi:hypothetical protein